MGRVAGELMSRYLCWVIPPPYRSNHFSREAEVCGKASTLATLEYSLPHPKQSHSLHPLKSSTPHPASQQEAAVSGSTLEWGHPPLPPSLLSGTWLALPCHQRAGRNSWLLADPLDCLRGVPPCRGQGNISEETQWTGSGTGNTPTIFP